MALIRSLIVILILMAPNISAAEDSTSALEKKIQKSRGKKLHRLILRATGGPVQESDYLTSAGKNPAKVELGRLLFHDKVLSGNKNISCSTCHHTDHGTSDGLSLPLGEGGIGVGPTRTFGNTFTGVFERVPRNSPALFNLGAKSFTQMFHDGRVAPDYNEASGFLSPAGEALPQGLDSPLAVQALFPPTSGVEMAGQAHENSIGEAAAQGDVQRIWKILVHRIQGIPEYLGHFQSAFDEISSTEDISIVHIANALAAWEDESFRTTDSPFDRYLKGNLRALSKRQIEGMKLFYGRAKCSQCHSGKFQTDMDFHSIGMIQFGPGKGDGLDGQEDFGRERVTGDPTDRYKFRTPSLRNVAITGPWGHTGAYKNLGGVIRNHIHPEHRWKKYKIRKAILPTSENLDLDDWVCLNNPICGANILASAEYPEINPLSRNDLKNLKKFLRSLTDPTHLDLSPERPDRVPSGLPID